MTMIKIEHADPKSSKPIAFDVMGVISKDAGKDHAKDAPAKTAPKITGERGLEGLEVKSTFVIERHGDFRLIDMSGGEMLHAVSEETLMQRTEDLRKETEKEEAKAQELADKNRAQNAPPKKNDLGNPNDAPGTGTGNHPPSIADTSANNPRSVPDLTPRPKETVTKTGR